MDDKSAIIDESVKDDVLRYPMVDLIRMLYPGHPVRRGVMRSPFRDDSNPSFSCFRGRNGISLGKDHSTGATYDNIMVYMESFPGCGYVEAVDRLAMLLFGRSALVGRERSDYVRRERRVVRPAVQEVSRESVLREVSEMSVLDPSVPDEMKRYWRGRGISDAVMSKMCSYYEIENRNRKGNALLDRKSGLPIMASDGSVELDDGLIRAVGHRNDIGGVVFRSPDTSVRKGFKGATSSFISVFLADDSRVPRTVSFFGDGDSYVHFLRYEKSEDSIYINPTQGFRGISFYEAARAMAFMSGFSGCLDQREKECACAVLSSLSVPVCRDVVLVEGMFDGLSDREIRRYGGSGTSDLVILNSVSNIRWTVPFLSRHERIISMMDNDLKSGAGQKAFREISREVEAFNSRVGGRSLIFDGSMTFGRHKDLNEALVTAKGFPEENKKKRVQ